MRAILANACCAAVFLAFLAGAQSPTAVRYRASDPLTRLHSLCYCMYYPDEVNNRGELVGRVDSKIEPSHVYFDSPDEPETRIFTQFSFYESDTSINDQGVIAGSFWLPEGYWSTWSVEDGFQTIPQLFESTEICSVSGINDSRQVVGRACFVGSWQGIAFRWDSVTGETIDLGHLPDSEFKAYPTAINARGDVVGRSLTPPGDSSPVEGFFWSADGGMRPLGRWVNGAAPTSVAAINDAGRVVGYAREPGPPYTRHPFIWDAETGFTELNVAPGPESIQDARPADINNSDTVVGEGFSNHDDRAFVWSANRGMRRLQSLLDPCDGGSHSLTKATGLNDLGVIVAYNETGQYETTKVLLLTPYLVGDLDSDAAVGLADLSIFLVNFGRSGGASYEDGDLDCDADVDLQDLSTLLANFGETLP